MMPPLPQANDEGGKGRKRLPFFGKKSRSPTRVDADELEHGGVADEISGSHHRRLRAVARENSAAHRPGVERDPRAEAQRRNSTGSSEGHVENISGSGRRRKSVAAGRRAALLDQQNSAVNVGAMARDPRMEQRGLGRVSENNEADMDELVPTPGKHKGRKKKEASPDNRGRRKASASLLSNYKIEDDPRIGRDSYRRRTVDSVEDGIEASSHTSGSDPSYHRARRNTVHATTHSLHTQSTNNSDEKSTFDEEPMTKPSAPAGRRNPNRISSFDVNETRDFLIRKLSREEDSFRSSLVDCLGGMGFAPDDIQRAIESTDAKSSADAPRVVEWLGEHEDECKSRSTGSGKVNERSVGADAGGTGDNMQYKSNRAIAERSVSTDSGDETHYTTATKKSHFSNATTDTTESDENVQELKDSLRNLGFSRDVIKRHKEMYRRHSREMNAEQFIAAMLEVEDERPPLPAEDPPPKPSPPRRKTPPEGDLVKSLSEMGFERKQVEGVIDRMHKSGSNVTADSVLGELLSGGGRHEQWSEPSNVSESARESHSSPPRSTQRPDRRNRSTVGPSNPSSRNMRRVKEEEEESLSIEIAPGQYARLLKGRQTWNAMHDGTAVAAPCTICNVTLQCTPDADYVLCPDCNVVSPLVVRGVRRGSTERDVMRGERGLSRTASVGRNVGAVGLGYRRNV